MDNLLVHIFELNTALSARVSHISYCSFAKPAIPCTPGKICQPLHCTTHEPNMMVNSLTAVGCGGTRRRRWWAVGTTVVVGRRQRHGYPDGK
jgi:hypothetical protein